MTTNDTRTARERAAELAAERFPLVLTPTYEKDETISEHRYGYVVGFLASEAEPTTVTAEQIEAAAKAMYEGSTGFKLTRGKPWSELSESTRETQLDYVRIAFRAAGFRIEGDPAVTEIERALEEERRIINAATGELVRHSTEYGQHSVKSKTGLTRATTGYGPDGGGAYVDAERLAHSWNALPLRNAQVQAVLALHKPDTVMTGDCEECSDFGDDDNPTFLLVPYPCATVRAIEEAGA